MTSTDAHPCPAAALRNAGMSGQGSGFRGTAATVQSCKLQSGRELWVGQELAWLLAACCFLGTGPSNQQLSLAIEIFIFTPLRLLSPPLNPLLPGNASCALPVVAPGSTRSTLALSPAQKQRRDGSGPSPSLHRRSGFLIACCCFCYCCL